MAKQNIASLLFLLFCPLTFTYSCFPQLNENPLYLTCDNGALCSLQKEIEKKGESFVASYQENDESEKYKQKRKMKTLEAEQTKNPGSIECFRINEYTVSCENTHFATTHMAHPGSSLFYFCIFMSISLILMAGLMSGLQLGILSLDLNSLAVLEKAGLENERKRARKVRPLLKRRHLMMVTLLVANAGCLEALPLLLDELLTPVANIILSVTAVLLFGEIIPQALCCRYGLTIGATLSPLVWILIGITFPISYPIAKLLDTMLGHHAQFFRRNELSELVKLQEQQGKGDEKLTEDEATIISGALQLSQKTVGDCMTSIDKVFMLEIGQRLDLETMKAIQADGHSRIPIYRCARDNIIGMLLVKQLILLDPDDEIPLEQLKIRRIPTVSTAKGLYELLNLFQTGKSHIAEVVSTEDHMTVVGVITLEDIIEELIQEEIDDEIDVVHAKPRARIEEETSTSVTMPVIVEDLKESLLHH